MKIAGIVLGCTAVDLIGHRLGPAFHYNAPPSVFIEKGLFIPAVVVLFIVTYGAAAAVFAAIQKELPGARLSKGFRYGISFGVLWFIGMIEMTLIAGSSLSYELYSGSVDGISFLLLGVLLGVYSGADSIGKADGRKFAAALVSVTVISLLFLIGRYFAYAVLHLESAYINEPLATFIWTLCLGVWVGVMYQLLRQGIGGNSAFARGLWFGVLVFGSDWLLYTLFRAVFVKIALIQIVLRVGVDVIFVSAGVAVSERLLSRAAGESSLPGTAKG
ncbi:MAG: hypothetical protein AB1500_05530 [Bacillota bacterium]